MRFLLATCLVAGCSFEHGTPLEVVDDPGTVAPPDAGSPTVARTCKYPDPALRLCIEFDNGVLSPMATDGSPHALDASASHVNVWLRQNLPAAATYSESSLSVREDAMLDITGAITLEAWMAVSLYHPAALVANQAQYSMGIDAAGRLVCRIGTLTVVTTESVDVNVWHHVACVFDGTTLTAFVDGDVERCTNQTIAIPISGTQGTQLAAGYTGAIDDVRIYARALAPAEICSHADKTGCRPSCGGRGGGGD